MRKYLYLLFVILFISGCSTFKGTMGRTQFQNAEKVIYEKIFGERIEITNTDEIGQLVNILGSATKEPVQFVPQEQFVFIVKGDTITVQRNGSSLKDGRGTYQLGAYMTAELNKLLDK